MKAFNGFLQKYGSMMCGYTVLGLPVFGRKSGEYLATSKIAATSHRITFAILRLINLSKAIGLIMTVMRTYNDWLVTPNW